MKKALFSLGVCLLAFIALIANANAINYGYCENETTIMICGIVNLVAEFVGVIQYGKKHF